MSTGAELAISHARPFDAWDLRSAFGTFATGVTVVTARGSDGADCGLTANSFSSVSLEPPLVLWSLTSTSASIDVFRSADHFAVYILAFDQEELSARFATRGIDRFAGLDPERGPDGVALIEGCAARFVCRTPFQYEGGDHTIFVGEVVDFVHSSRAPLVFHGGRYGCLLRHEPEPPIASDPDLIGPSPNDVVHGVANAYHLMRRDATVERRRRGWTECQYLAMSVLGWRDGCRLDDIDAFARTRGLTISPATLVPLMSDGLIRADVPLSMGSGIWLTDAGREAVVSMVAILKSGEAAAMEPLDASEVRLLKQLLGQVGGAEKRKQ